MDGLTTTLNKSLAIITQQEACLYTTVNARVAQRQYHELAAQL
jgi:hypothetical protein